MKSLRVIKVHILIDEPLYIVYNEYKSVIMKLFDLLGHKSRQLHIHWYYDIAWASNIHTNWYTFIFQEKPTTHIMLPCKEQRSWQSR